MNLKSFLKSSGLIAISLLIGCAAHDSVGQWSGPKMLSEVSVENLTTTPAAKVFKTKHYKIYSTIENRPGFVERVAQLMEGGLLAYQKLAPAVNLTDYPMDCYLFASRGQWQQFTEAHTGQDATVYLKISRGGYTIHDWYVAYYIGEIGTYSVAAHEGWHQFVARHFKGRLPPFLEEGIACMFEDVEWDGDLPRFNLSMNPARAQSLRKAVDEGQLFPLDKLITLHAGQVVNLADVKIQAFYGQDWAFAAYLWEGENGKFRPALQRLLADTAAGTVYDPTGSMHRSYLAWNPAGVKPMLEHYLGEDFSEIEKGYTAFVNKIAYDEMRAQFQMQG